MRNLLEYYLQELNKVETMMAKGVLSPKSKARIKALRKTGAMRGKYDFSMGDKKAQKNILRRYSVSPQAGGELSDIVGPSYVPVTSTYVMPKTQRDTKVRNTPLTSKDNMSRREARRVSQELIRHEPYEIRAHDKLSKMLSKEKQPHISTNIGTYPGVHTSGSVVAQDSRDIKNRKNMFGGKQQSDLISNSREIESNYRNLQEPWRTPYEDTKIDKNLLSKLDREEVETKKTLAKNKNYTDVDNKIKRIKERIENASTSKERILWKMKYLKWIKSLMS